MADPRWMRGGRARAAISSIVVARTVSGALRPSPNATRGAGTRVAGAFAVPVAGSGFRIHSDTAYTHSAHIPTFCFFLWLVVFDFFVCRFFEDESFIQNDREFTQSGMCNDSFGSVQVQPSAARHAVRHTTHTRTRHTAHTESDARERDGARPGGRRGPGRQKADLL